MKRLDLIKTATLQELAYSYGMEIEHWSDVERVIELLRFDIEFDAQKQYRSLFEPENFEEQEAGYDY